MNDGINFTVLGEPVGKARVRVTRFGNYTPEATVLYENLVKTEYRRQCGDKRFADDQPLYLQVKGYYTIPASATKKKKALMLEGKLRPMKKPDWDNVGKVVSDALNQIAYRDDVQVVDSRVIKFYSDRPRVMIKIMPAEEGDMI